MYFFLHYHVALEVELALVPVGAVGQVRFACYGVSSKLLGYRLVVRSAFISAGLAGFSFRIWHDVKYLILVLF